MSGSITTFGNETKNMNLGGAGSALGGFGLGGFGHKKSKAIVALTARMIDVDTGEISPSPKAVANPSVKVRHSWAAAATGRETYHGDNGDTEKGLSPQIRVDER